MSTEPQPDPQQPGQPPEPGIGPSPSLADPVAADEHPTPPHGTLARPLSGWRLWTRDLLFSAAAAMLIITFVYQPVRVEGTSMLPRLVDQDRLFINKFIYQFTAISRGDVLVFHYPRNVEISYIKRVIALPGDHVQIEHGRVIVNGKQVDEPYVPPEFRDERSIEPITVPDGEYFVLGDHRSISSDSRDFGPVKRSLIYGKAAFVYWPTQDVGVVH